MLVSWWKTDVSSQRWEKVGLLSCQQKKGSRANIHKEEEMSTTVMDIFSSDTQLQQRTPVISLVNTTGYTGRTGNAPQHHPLQPGLWQTRHFNRRTMNDLDFLPVACMFLEYVSQVEIQQNAVRLKTEITNFPRCLDTGRSKSWERFLETFLTLGLCSNHHFTLNFWIFFNAILGHQLHFG